MCVSLLTKLLHDNYEILHRIKTNQELGRDEASRLLRIRQSRSRLYEARRRKRTEEQRERYEGLGIETLVIY